MWVSLEQQPYYEAFMSNLMHPQSQRRKFAVKWADYAISICVVPNVANSGVHKTRLIQQKLPKIWISLVQQSQYEALMSALIHYQTDPRKVVVNLTNGAIIACVLLNKLSSRIQKIRLVKQKLSQIQIFLRAVALV